MIKSLLTIVLVATALGYANEASENLFIQGQYCKNTGRDSLACVYYERALAQDTGSATLQEVYAASLLKIKDTSKTVVMLRKCAYSHVKAQGWLTAMPMFKTLYDLSKDYSDGAMLGLVIFKYGVQTGNDTWISTAIEVWENLSARAQMSNNANGSSIISAIRTQAGK